MNLHRDVEFVESHFKVDHNVDGVLPTRVYFGIDNTTNGEATNSMDPTIEIVDAKFDKEKLTSDEWLQMMQQKCLIDMLLFGKRSPLVS